MGGQIAAIIATLPLLASAHKSGKVRLLAHSGDKRATALPDIATFQEAGFPSLTMTEMFVYVGSSRLPAATQRELSTALTAAVATPSVRTALQASEYESLALSPVDIAARLRSETQRWARLVKATGYKAES